MCRIGGRQIPARSHRCGQNVVPHGVRLKSDLLLVPYLSYAAMREVGSTEVFGWVSNSELGEAICIGYSKTCVFGEK